MTLFQKFKKLVFASIKELAKFYNMLPKKVTIVVMASSSYVFATWTGLLIKDLRAVSTNDYLKALIDGLIPVLAIIYNLLQMEAKIKGTEALALINDPQTINYLTVKIQNTKDLVNTSQK